MGLNGSLGIDHTRQTSNTSEVSSAAPVKQTERNVDENTIPATLAVSQAASRFKEASVMLAQLEKTLEPVKEIAKPSKPPAEIMGPIATMTETFKELAKPESAKNGEPVVHSDPFAALLKDFKPTPGIVANEDKTNTIASMDASAVMEKFAALAGKAEAVTKPGMPSVQKINGAEAMGLNT